MWDRYGRCCGLIRLIEGKGEGEIVGWVVNI